MLPSHPRQSVRRSQETWWIITRNIMIFDKQKHITAKSCYKSSEEGYKLTVPPICFVYKVIQGNMSVTTQIRNACTFALELIYHQYSWHLTLEENRGYKILIMLTIALQWRHNERNCVSNHQPRDCLLNRADQRKQQSSASLAFVRIIHLWPVNYSHKEPVTRKLFPLDEVIMALREVYPSSARTTRLRLTH